MRSRIQRAVTSLLAIAVSGVVLVGCTGDPDEIAECEELVERTALSVEGVETADFTCWRDFGNPGEQGTVSLAVETQQDADLVIEDVYRAFASEPDIDNSWVVYFEFTSKSGEAFNIEALGFNGTPSIRDLRDRYDIHPPGAE